MEVTLKYSFIFDDIIECILKDEIIRKSLKQKEYSSVHLKRKNFLARKNVLGEITFPFRTKVFFRFIYYYMLVDKIFRNKNCDEYFIEN